MLPHPAVLKSRYQKKRLVSFHFSFCEIICWWHLHWYLSSGEDVRGGGGNLHGVLGAVPHLLHPLLPLSSDRPQGVDLQCLLGGAVILITSQSTTYFRPIFIGKNNLDLFSSGNVSTCFTTWMQFYWLAMANSCVNPIIYYWMNARWLSN